jgi:hypothetical protein
VNEELRDHSRRSLYYARGSRRLSYVPAAHLGAPLRRRQLAGSKGKKTGSRQVETAAFNILKWMIIRCIPTTETDEGSQDKTGRQPRG